MNNEKCVCVACCDFVDQMYNFRDMCLKNGYILKNYVSKLRAVSKEHGDVYVNVTDLKTNEGENKAKSDSDPTPKPEEKSFSIEEFSKFESEKNDSEPAQSESVEKNELKKPLPPKTPAKTASPATSTKKTYTCNHCTKVFTASKLFVKHYKSHKKRMPFKCKVCKKGFIFSKDLIKHLKNHIKNETVAEDDPKNDPETS